MDTAGKLFGGTSRVKVMRLFLLNKESTFTTKDVRDRSKITASQATKELNFLYSIGFLKKKAIPSKTKTKKVKSKKKKSKKAPATSKKYQYFFNENFVYKNALEEILIEKDSVSRKDMAGKFKRAGRVKTLVVSGVFLKDNDNDIDMLVVGDNLKKNIVDRIISDIEADMGTEISYAVFDTEEFLYRASMRDKLIADVFDFPHEFIIDGLKLST
ncbi:hypothetical protein KC842_03170 [Candidatus Nomurabacteria bacterium]|nr:hypothetical protein [Candidatus Nomurabacteria bacterium]USN94555.1 MAG: hypothetical protein H6791_02230 [Candidatus Nomurabacteria bacterium]